MDKYLKFIFQKTTGKIQKRILNIIKDVLSNDLDSLDIKKLKGYKNRFRVRISDIRIVFEKKSDGNNVILRINRRGDIY